MSEILTAKETLSTLAPADDITVGGTEREPKLPDHLVQLPGGQWNLWRWVGVRGAGFAAEQVLRLAAPECAMAAQLLLEAEDEAQQAQTKALGALRDDLENASTERRSPLLTAIQILKKGKQPKTLNFECTGQRMLEALSDAHARRKIALSEFQQKYAAANAQISQVIRQVIQQDRFRCAVTWQNRQAVHTSIKSLLRKSPESIARGSKQRQHEEMVASYLQRYCVKNDTIGFFGPMGWGKLVTQGEIIVVSPGPSLLATRNVRFETWCIHAIANRLAKNKALQPWLTPRQMPLTRLDGTTLHLANQHSLKIPPKLAMVLRACNGERTASQIAVGLTKIPSIGFRCEEVFELLEELRSRAFISWTLEVPSQLNPEQHLRGLLGRIEDDSLRGQCLHVLDEIEHARDKVRQVADDPEKLDQSLAELEGTFTQLTGISATRNHGQTYAGRTLVYEDCRRDVEINIGPDFLETLGPPLSLILTSARWLTYWAGSVYRKSLFAIYHDLVRKTGSTVIEASAFLRPLFALFSDDSSSQPLVESIMSDFHERWSRLLAVPDGQHKRIQYSCEELRPRVMEMFHAPHPGWRAACYHSPDVMVLANDLESFRRGDYQLVMGELHVASNTLKAACFVAQHPHPEELTRCYDADLPDLRLLPLLSQQFFISRAFPLILSNKDLRLLCGNDAYALPGQKTVAISVMVVEEVGDQLVLRSRDGQHSFEILDVCTSIIVSQVVQRFSLLGSRRYIPRITFDRVVVCRESWRFSSAELQFAEQKSAADRFLAARKWMQAHDMPRFVFVKVPTEVKPFYVDFESPIYVDILAKNLRRAKEGGGPDALVSVTEMLPQPHQIWLHDAQGQRYTSELRFITVDPVGAP